MNIVELYATRGVRFYFGMPAQDFLNGVNSVPMFLQVYTESGENIEMVQKAIVYRERAEEALANAKAGLQKAQDDKVYYDKELSNYVDQFLAQVQTIGGFLADGLNPIPQYVLPQQNLTGIYQKMEQDNATPRYVDQIWVVIPEAEDLVAKCTRELEEAKDLEEKVVRTCIYKMLYTHV